MRPLSLALALALTPLACNHAPSPAAPPEELAEQQRNAEWRKTRIERLTAPAGWLSLAGLHWLKPGQNEFTLPGQQSKLGSFDVTSSEVTFTPAPGVEVKHDGKPVQRLALKDDAKGEATRLEAGTFSFHLIRRNDRLGVRLRDTESKARREFHGIEMFPALARYRVTARWEPASAPVEVPVPTILGTIDKMPSPGVARFQLDGKELQLRPVLEEGDPRLFFIFADQSTGKTTYGAGRFLYADPPRDGQVVLDFNQAYNPPCAFTPYATCPLPLEENKLPVYIEAGEKDYGHHQASSRR